jgi:hypothetical protein
VSPLTLRQVAPLLVFFLLGALARAVMDRHRQH